MSDSPKDGPAIEFDWLAQVLADSLADYCRASGHAVIAWNEAQTRAIAVYLETLLVWRTRLSLISVEDPREIVIGHIADSLSVAPFLLSGSRVADIGSGAGFPGVPLAIARPDVRFALVEARRKRANFLREVVRRCGLANTVVLEGRAEEIRDREGFDRFVVRAVGDDLLLAKLAGPLAKAGAQMIAMRSGGQAEGSGEQVFRYRLADGRERALTFLPVPA